VARKDVEILKLTAIREGFNYKTIRAISSTCIELCSDVTETEAYNFICNAIPEGGFVIKHFPVELKINGVNRYFFARSKQCQTTCWEQ